MDISELRNQIHVVGATEFRAMETLFGSGKYRVHGPHAEGAASSIIQSQKESHQYFFSIIFQKIDIYRKNNKNILEITKKIIDSSVGIASYSIQSDKENGYIISVPRVPIFTSVEIEKFMEEINISGEKFRNYSYASDFVGLVFAMYLDACREINSVQASVKNTSIEVDVDRMAARMEALRLLDQPSESLGFAAQELKNELSGAEERLALIGKRLSELRNNGEGIAQAHNGLIRDIEELKHQIGTLKTTQQAGLAEIKESLKLDEARNLWKEFGSNASIAFWTSFVVIIAILIAFPLVAFWQRAEIIDFLTNLELRLSDGSNGNGPIANTFTAFGRLLVITAPLGFVVWLVRLLVRFNMRSMLLMDDARARVTMLNTYLFLISQDAAVKQDRGAILEALFRRAPGHGSDTSEPPHFTDLLRYGQEGKSNG